MKKIDESGWCAFIVLGFIVMVVLLVFGGSYVCNGLKFNEVGAVARIEYISAIQTSSNIEGNFFLGSGSISEEQYYYYFAKTPDGGHKMKNIPVELATVYEAENETPRIEFLYRSRLEAKRIWDFNYRVYVPKGSILLEYNVKLPED